jgi:hypothetical protein
MGGGKRGKRLLLGRDPQFVFLEKSGWDERENERDDINKIV